MERLFNKITGFFNWIAVIALLLMFATITLDILSSKIINRPITATVDIMSLLATCVASFSLAETIKAGRHIEVDFIISRMPFKIRKILNVVSRLLSMGFFMLIVWRSLVYARNLQVLKEATLTQHIPVAPFVYGIAVACIPAIFIYLVDAYRSIREVK
ncbi:MAG TPA: TRAP transporter small permease [Syntrophorhabdaceae bacterium]|mgnify:CR=1 FL=1|nr:TRAP transporter small permease [Syntrophorhabdaceae bacterium]HPU29811.1 TRAP transporter small permease [Syntrophorhabdaceae bacterium]